MENDRTFHVAVPRVYGEAGLEDDTIADYGGYVAEVTGAVYNKVKPRWSLLQREKIARAERPADDRTLNRLLRGFPADWANSFMRSNKLVGTDNDVCEFAPRVPLAKVVDECFRETEADGYNRADSYRTGATEAIRVGEPKKAVPKYYLHQIFSDTSVAEKLGLDVGIMIVVSRAAVADPKAACDLIVKHAKANGMEVSVRVGDYSTGRKASRQRLLDAASNLTSMPYTCDVVGNKVAVSGVSGVGASSKWTIVAQLWQMPEVDAVYRLASAKGVTMVNALFTLDMAKLGVELTVERSDYGYDVQLHMGEYDASVSGNRVSAFGDHVVEASRGVFPIVCDGKVVASAVYAGERKFFVNWHVVAGLNERRTENGVSPVSIQLDYSSDELVSMSLLNEVADDVWLAELDVGVGIHLSHLNPPVCRAAVPGEPVIAVYATPTGVECTDHVIVEELNVGAVCMPRFPQARLGMSGAALLALSDGALLGSYTGSNRTYSLGSAVHSRSHFDWLGKLAAPVLAPHAYISGKGAGAVYQDIKARGLGPDISKISDAISLLTSDGKVVGSQCAYRSGLVTTLDPTVWNVCDDSGMAADFTRAGEGGVKSLRVGDTPILFRRNPALGEQVFAVGKDNQGVFFSDLFKVTWVAADRDVCRLDGVPEFEGKPMRGAVLVALSDCAAFGLVSKLDEAAWGKYAESTLWSKFFPACGRFIGDNPKQELFQRLSSRFQSLKTTTWEETDVRALVVGDTPSAGAYSRVGVSATLATLFGHFSQRDIRGIERAITTKFSDDTWMIGLCDKMLPNCGNLFGSSCADRLNTLRIFLGLVYLREGNSGLDYVLDEIGLFDVDGYDEETCVENFLDKRPRSV